MPKRKWKPAGPGVHLIVRGIVYEAAPIPEGMEPDGYVAMADDDVIGRADSLSGAQALCERAITQASQRTKARKVDGRSGNRKTQR